MKEICELCRPDGALMAALKKIVFLLAATVVVSLRFDRAGITIDGPPTALLMWTIYYAVACAVLIVLDVFHRGRLLLTIFINAVLLVATLGFSLFVVRAEWVRAAFNWLGLPGGVVMLVLVFIILSTNYKPPPSNPAR